MDDKIIYGNQEIKIIDRASISLSGVNKIISFDDEEFIMDSIMGLIHIKGENLELIKLDTNDGNVKIKGKINSLLYLDGDKRAKEDSFFAKLFK